MTAERRVLPKAGKLALSTPGSSEVLAAGRNGAVKTTRYLRRERRMAPSLVSEQPSA